MSLNWLSHFGGQVQNLLIEMKNSGQTPAYNYTGYLISKIDASAFSLQFPHPLPPELSIKRGDLGSGEIVELGGLLNDVTVEELADIHLATKAFHVLGRLNYRDAFGKERHTVFRLISLGSLFAEGRFSTNSESSESN